MIKNYFFGGGADVILVAVLDQFGSLFSRDGKLLGIDFDRVSVRISEMFELTDAELSNGFWMENGARD